jgi:hypothetical protein
MQGGEVTDRDQIRRDAERQKGDDAFRGPTGILARHCLALLTELEQAESMIDKVLAEADAANDDWNAVKAELEQAERDRDHGQRLLEVERHDRETAEARLAKVPALVEALRDALRLLNEIDQEWTDGGTSMLTPVGYKRLERSDAALAAWENE